MNVLGFVAHLNLNLKLKLIEILFFLKRVTLLGVETTIVLKPPIYNGGAHLLVL